MDCPIGTVRSRIFRAREAIAEQLRPLLETRQGQEVVGVMKEQISALMDGELDDESAAQTIDAGGRDAGGAATPGAPIT